MITPPRTTKRNRAPSSPPRKRRGVCKVQDDRRSDSIARGCRARGVKPNLRYHGGRTKQNRKYSGMFGGKRGGPENTQVNLGGTKTDRPTGTKKRSTKKRIYWEGAL